ncbi:MAG: hypothetical protein K0S30_1405 [Clostridia bacterium]|nr:hypothetical protein [Clostridia bacterium]
MKIIGKKSLASFVKILLDLIFIGGIGILCKSFGYNRSVCLRYCKRNTKDF